VAARQVVRECVRASGRSAGLELGGHLEVGAQLFETRAIVWLSPQATIRTLLPMHIQIIPVSRGCYWDSHTQ
jgi:hypothetical protein